jgi:hypothetical protein
MPRGQRAPTVPARAAAATAIAAPLPANAVLITPPEQAPKPAKLKALLSAHRTATENMNEIKDALGGQMSDATENHHVDKTAFGWIKRLDKVSPEKGNDIVSHFLYYLDASGLRARFEAAQRLPLNDEATVTNVRPFPRQPAAEAEAAAAQA